MEQTIKISVLIPAYNAAATIDACLDSVRAQSLREIEILVTDDGSTDDTLARVRAAAARDGRIRVLRHPSNLGLLQARKDGVLASRGEYLLFVDSDDYIEPETCRLAYDKARETGADVLQFGTAVERFTELETDRIAASMRPYLGPPITGSLLTACFVDKLFSVQLWNKLFRGELARRVYRRIPDGYFYYLEDIYQLFYLLADSRSYAGLDLPLYHYCYGRGLCGQKLMSLAQYAPMCDGGRVLRALEQALEDRGEDLPAGREAVEVLREYFVKRNLGLALSRVRPEDRTEALRLMAEAWVPYESNFPGLLARCGWGKREKLAAALRGAAWLRFEGRPVRRLGLYAPELRAEERAAALRRLEARLAEAEGECELLLITDQQPADEDTAPPAGAIQIPAREKSRRRNYEPRAAAWQRLAGERGLDALVYLGRGEQSLLWDLLSVKSAAGHPAFVLWLPEDTALQFGESGGLLGERRQIYALADALMLPAETDRRYWAGVNPRSYGPAQSWPRLLRDLERGSAPETPDRDPETEAFFQRLSEQHGAALRRLGQEKKKLLESRDLALRQRDELAEKLGQAARELAALRAELAAQKAPGGQEKAPAEAGRTARGPREGGLTEPQPK